VRPPRSKNGLLRQHGVPTRLLDWSESLAAAIFFALGSADLARDLDLWLLDPYALNKQMFGAPTCWT